MSPLERQLAASLELSELRKQNVALREGLASLRRANDDNVDLAISLAKRLEELGQGEFIAKLVELPE